MFDTITEYEAFEADTLKEAALTLLVPARLASFARAGGSITLMLEADVCERSDTVLGTPLHRYNDIATGETLSLSLRLDLLSPAVLRMRLFEANACEASERDLPLLAETPEAVDCFTLAETEDALTLKTERIAVEFGKDPFTMTVTDAKGRILYRSFTGDAHTVSADRRASALEQLEDEAARARMERSRFTVKELPAGLARDAETGRRFAVLTAPIFHGEHFYGFGEHFGPLDKKGSELLNFICNPQGVSSKKSYKCAPFFLSSRGYACFFNTARKLRFSMGDFYFKSHSAVVYEDALDVFLFLTGDAKENLAAYTALTGRCAVPPKWSLGVWMSRNCYRSQEEMLAVAARLRAEELPCDVLHLDWNYCKTYDYDFAFDPARFPDPKAMTDALLAQGMRLSIWQIPYVNFTADTFAETAPRGLLARLPDGTPADPAEKQGVLDFSNPETVRWYQEKIRALARLGARVIKTDFGENAQESYVYSGYDGRDMHNLYPLLYNRAAYEAVQEVHPGDSLVWGRGAYAGCQRYPLYWSGDCDSDYAGMYHSLRGGLSLGLSGFPLWSHDVGGYFGTPEPAVYIRWMEFGMLSPVVRFHGVSPREPWAFGERAVALYRKYAALRYSLIEYLYAQTKLCCETGLPMLRALALEFPDDPLCACIDDCYLLGDSLLVAPVFSDESARELYLPAGTDWIDFHSGNRFAGGRSCRVDTPLEITPLFLRGGRIVPFVAPAQQVETKPLDALELAVCPMGGNAVCSTESDRLSLRCAYREDGDGAGRLVLEGLTDGVKLSCTVYGTDCTRLFVNGRAASLAERDSAKRVYRWNA